VKKFVLFVLKEGERFHIWLLNSFLIMFGVQTQSLCFCDFFASIFSWDAHPEVNREVTGSTLDPAYYEDFRCPTPVKRQRLQMTQTLNQHAVTELTSVPCVPLVWPV